MPKKGASPNEGATDGAEIARRLEMTPACDSPNRISERQLRAWAIDYLSDQDEDVVTDPELLGRPHWNLWMMDSRFEDALFAVLAFGDTKAEFFCGTGDAFAIRRYAGCKCSDDVSSLAQEMKEKFSVPLGSLILTRKAVEGWLGRGW